MENNVIKIKDFKAYSYFFLIRKTFLKKPGYIWKTFLKKPGYLILFIQPTWDKYYVEDKINPTLKLNKNKVNL